MVPKYEGSLQYRGAMHFPDEITDQKRQFPQQHPYRWAWRALECVVCIRASLVVLNQMIFQQIRDEKLPFIGDKHVFSTVNWIRNDAGNALSFQYQADDQNHILEPSDLVIVDSLDLVIVDSIENHIHTKGLFQINQFGLNIGGVDGTYQSVVLRSVDEHLCPYEDLWNAHWF